MMEMIVLTSAEANWRSFLESINVRTWQRFRKKCCKFTPKPTSSQLFEHMKI